MLCAGHARRGAQPRIPADVVRKVLCSLGVGPHEELLQLSGQTFAIFAEHHGYDLEIRTRLGAPDRPPSWSKIPLFLELFATYDFVLWVDADCAIVDPTRDIAADLARTEVMAMVAHSYDGQVVPNCGVWALRRTRSVQSFLERVWSRTEYLDHDWWENAAVIDELGYSVEPPIRVLGRNRMRQRVRFLDSSWNSIGADVSEHPRINHYPGRSHEHRLASLTRDVETARAVASAWTTAATVDRSLAAGDAARG